jgi:hypothetical protein
MALQKTQSAAVSGIGAHRTDVEVDRRSAGAPRRERSQTPFCGSAMSRAGSDPLRR